MKEIMVVGGDLWKSHVLQDKKTTLPGVTWKELWVSALSWSTVSFGWTLLGSALGKSGQGLHGHEPTPDWLLASVAFNAPVSSSDNRDTSRRVIFKYVLLPGSWMHCQCILKLWSMSSVFFLLKIFNKFNFFLYLLKIWMLLSQNHRIVRIGNDLWRSCSSIFLLKQGHLEQFTQEFIQGSLEWIQRGKLHTLPGQLF